ncbi:MAG: hypothetical protein MJE66_15905 [Proteobacteria bacterium]|nr:hypothetical protein [Pseudomonadota bacterium]
MHSGPPVIDPTPIGAPPRPTRVYSVGQMIGATLLGGPLGGCVLLASNFLLFGATQRRTQALVGGVVASVLVMVLGFFLPERVPDSALPAAYTIALQQLASRTQGAEIETFLASGGSKHSHWRVAGIGAACLAGILAALFAVLLALPEAWLESVPE